MAVIAGGWGYTVVGGGRLHFYPVEGGEDGNFPLCILPRRPNPYYREGRIALRPFSEINVEACCPACREKIRALEEAAG